MKQRRTREVITRRQHKLVSVWVANEVLVAIVSLGSWPTNLLRIGKVQSVCRYPGPAHATACPFGAKTTRAKCFELARRVHVEGVAVDPEATPRHHEIVGLPRSASLREALLAIGEIEDAKSGLLPYETIARVGVVPCFHAVCALQVRKGQEGMKEARNVRLGATCDFGCHYMPPGVSQNES